MARNAVTAEGRQRILLAVQAKYGEQRELEHQEVVFLGKKHSDAYFVFIAYVPCNYDECPDHRIITDLVN